MRKIVRELHSKQNIVLLDVQDISEAIQYDPNRDLDISVIIQEGFAVQREAEGLADATTDDADPNAPSRTDAAYKALLELRMLFRKEDTCRMVMMLKMNRTAYVVGSRSWVSDLMTHHLTQQLQ